MLVGMFAWRHEPASAGEGAGAIARLALPEHRTVHTLKSLHSLCALVLILSLDDKDETDLPVLRCDFTGSHLSMNVMKVIS